MPKIIYDNGDEPNDIVTNYKDDNNNINLNNNMQYEQWKKIFQSVWKNMVLYKLISEHTKLYTVNECVEFKSRKELLQYKQRGYIHKIIYYGYELEAGDLPINGVLKEVFLKNINGVIYKDNLIPYGVEIIQFNICLHCRLSTFPITVHTVIGVSVDEIYNNKVVNNNNFKMESITFSKCPKLTYNDNDNNFKLPNTLKELKLPIHWDNDRLELRVGDLPYGVEKLSLIGYRGLKNTLKDALPNTIKQLEINANDRSYLENRGIVTSLFSYGYENNKGLFKCLPVNLESLTIHIFNHCIISPNSSLAKTCTNLQSLSINVMPISILKANSLPPSITKLFIKGFSNLKIEINSIPSNVKKLTLITNTTLKLEKGYLPNSIETLKVNRLITIENILPKSLKHLKIINYYSDEQENFTTENITKMISILPSSLQTITLPESTKVNITN